MLLWRKIKANKVSAPKNAITETAPTRQPPNIEEDRNENVTCAGTVRTQMTDEDCM